MSKNDSQHVAAYKREVAFGMLGSIFFSVLIIFANKFLFQHFDFQYAATLTAWHILITAVIVKMSVTFGVIANERMPEGSSWLFASANAFAMALQNLTLAYNTVSTYQISKLLIIPVTVTIDACSGAGLPNKRISFALCTLLLGVAIATLDEVHINHRGLVMAVMSAILTAGVTSATHAMQKKHSVSSNEFLANIMPKQTLIMIVSGPIMDYTISRGSVVCRDFEWSGSSIFAIR